MPTDKSALTIAFGTALQRHRPINPNLESLQLTVTLRHYRFRCACLVNQSSDRSLPANTSLGSMDRVSDRPPPNDTP
ncbi:MAG: hypothetical protein F6J87_27280 [Spirulina sp. SIO3F2]|nr:hypothetical protein [Spirulina sp. SIO3F2]